MLYNPDTEKVADWLYNTWSDAYTNCAKCGAKLIRREILGFKRETGGTYVKQVYIICSSLVNAEISGNSSHDVWYVDIKRVKKKKRWWFI